jgi:hypothetical protein
MDRYPDPVLEPKASGYHILNKATGGHIYVHYDCMADLVADYVERKAV